MGDIALPSLSKDVNGPLSVMEMISPADVLTHSPLITSFLNQVKAILTSGYTKERKLVHQIAQLMSVTDLLIMVGLIYSYKPFLRALYEVTHYFSKDKTAYRSSLIGYLEEPVKYVVLFPPFLCVVDLFSIFINYFGFDFHIKGNLPRLACTLATAGLLGSFATKFKDWIFHRLRRRLHHNSRDIGKERISDEISSTLIWTIIGAFCLEVASKEIGVGLGSIFALGGIGSASFVLAMRSSMENLVGGLLLKLQDKFRVGEKISLPSGGNDVGTVEEMQYLSTRIRKDDDSFITVPNAKFIQGEVINWSRTPFRLFKTSINVKEANIALLPTIIKSLLETLKADPGVESKQRDLIVAATGFNAGNIVVEIQARLKGTSDKDISDVKTRVVDKIACTVDGVYGTHGSPLTMK